MNKKIILYLLFLSFLTSCEEKATKTKVNVFTLKDTAAFELIKVNYYDGYRKCQIQDIKDTFEVKEECCITLEKIYSTTNKGTRYDAIRGYYSKSKLKAAVLINNSVTRVYPTISIILKGDTIIYNNEIMTYKRYKYDNPISTYQWDSKGCLSKVINDNRIKVGVSNSNIFSQIDSAMYYLLKHNDTDLFTKGITEKTHKKVDLFKDCYVKYDTLNSRSSKYHLFEFIDLKTQEKVSLCAQKSNQIDLPINPYYGVNIENDGIVHLIGSSWSKSEYPNYYFCKEYCDCTEEECMEKVLEMNTRQ